MTRFRVSESDTASGNPQTDAAHDIQVRRLLTERGGMVIPDASSPVQ
jgi:hypothetical protein